MDNKYKKLLFEFRSTMTKFMNMYQKEAKRALKDSKKYTTIVELEDRVSNHNAAHSAFVTIEMLLTILNENIKKSN